MVLLDVKNVSMFFGGLAAVSNVSFEVNKGEVLGLIGPNGAGKTTIFNMVNGFYHPSKGTVHFKGEKISGLRPYQICKRGMARTFQVVKPLQRMSVLDNVIASAYVRTNKKSRAEEIAREAIEFTGLLDDINTISKSLPLGKRKKLEITRALATQPEMLFLDESCAGLNHSELDEAIGIIKKIKEKGITLMVIEHHMKVIMSISDRIVVVNYGQKIADGTPHEIGTNRDVIEAYLGEAHDA
jgi:branched-chain amino acid transport system ATP-binding protein